MAYGQIDPARLDGDALTRWYLRSPADIEQEQQAAAAQKYNAFFGPLRDGSQGDEPRTGPAPNTGMSWNTSDAGQSDAQDADPTSLPNASPPGPYDLYQPDSINSGHYQLAAATIPGFWGHWTVPSCANCHGYTPGTLPPAGGHFPFPPNYSPRSGGSDGSGGPPSSSGGRGSAGSNPPQCAIQYDNDSAICRRLPNPGARGRCWESAAEREAYCIRSKGEVRFPPLITR